MDSMVPADVHQHLRRSVSLLFRRVFTPFMYSIYNGATWLGVYLLTDHTWDLGGLIRFHLVVKWRECHVGVRSV
jgi:hypothetical protein